MNRFFHSIIRRPLLGLSLLFTLVLLPGCESFLDEKPDRKLAVPSTLQDLQALLDYMNAMNYYSPIASAETSADDYYLTPATWAAISNESERRKYTWEKDNLFHADYYPNNWNDLYHRTYYANTVLESLERIERNSFNQATWENVKGQALFHRAQAFLNGAFVWTLAFDEATADTDLGLPLRLSTNFNETSVRASVRETYTQILRDLLEAAELLPVKAVHVMRPSQPAAHGLLARTYLVMRRYQEAGLHADKSLQLYDRLLDYNTLDAASAFPFPQSNIEVLQENSMSTPQPVQNEYARIDSTLYRLYEEDDLRKILFFGNNSDGTHFYRGSYEGNIDLFAGVATDEVYLMQAESRARDGDAAGAMASLNTLLRTRWRTGTYVERTASDPAAALTLVLQERRKQLLMRGLRWMDVKRLNKEGANITLVRQLGDKTYTLPPGDLRYALPLPEDVIALSGMRQNPR